MRQGLSLGGRSVYGLQVSLFIFASPAGGQAGPGPKLGPVSPGKRKGDTTVPLAAASAPESLKAGGVRTNGLWSEAAGRWGRSPRGRRAATLSDLG